MKKQYLICFIISYLLFSKKFLWALLKWTICHEINFTFSRKRMMHKNWIFIVVKNKARSILSVLYFKRSKPWLFSTLLYCLNLNRGNCFWRNFCKKKEGVRLYRHQHHRRYGQLSDTNANHQYTTKCYLKIKKKTHILKIF